MLLTDAAAIGLTPGGVARTKPRSTFPAKRAHLSRQDGRIAAKGRSTAVIATSSISAVGRRHMWVRVLVWTDDMC